MEISNDVLFMLAIILLFFCLMKDRPCNVEGMESEKKKKKRKRERKRERKRILRAEGDPSPKPLDPSQYMLKIYPKSRRLYPIFPNLSGVQNEWYKSRFDQRPIDFRKCSQEGGKCIKCSSIAQLIDGCKKPRPEGQEYNFDLNSYKARQGKYTYAIADGPSCDGGNCGIICESQGPDDTKTPGVGFPQGQNGLFCKV